MISERQKCAGSALTQSASVTECSPDDSALLRRISADDAAASAELFERYQARLQRSALRRIGSTAIAEEIVQDVFLALWERRRSLAIRSGIATYLYVAVRNGITSHLRRERLCDRFEVLAATALQNDRPGIDTCLTQAETDVAVRAAIARLPERCRLVVTYHRLLQMSYREVACALGISPKTVDAQLVRAVKLLRVDLRAWRS